MEILVKRQGHTRVPITEKVSANKVTAYMGRDILCDGMWSYVWDGDNWQYFGTIREAKSFIKKTYWG